MSALYYSDPHVRARILEFMGGSSLETATAEFISRDGRHAFCWYDPRPVCQLWQCAEEGAEIARSLWDRRSLIAHLDIEYVNFDDSAEPYLHPSRAFDVQRPVVSAIKEILLEMGVAPLHLLSGRGHHFLWRVDGESTAFAGLAMAGRVPETVGGKYAQPQAPNRRPIKPELAAAFAGLGLVMEYLSHRVLARTVRSCAVPVELTAVEVGPIDHGREIVSIDLSEYGDPLHTRTTRIPYTVYAKPQHCSIRTASGAATSLPPLWGVPLHEMDERQALLAMRDSDEVRALARRASVEIPDQSAGTHRLLTAYLESPLSKYHDEFYSVEHEPPLRWGETYDRLPLDVLPVCVSRILRDPNDLLLKPAGIQHVVRTLLAVGWHPRHIAGLIRSKYERDFGWGAMWFVYDAAMRAEFYTRLFSGLIAMRLDELVDYNCRSTQEKGYCCSTYCGPILERHRIALRDQQRNAAECPSS